MSGSDSSSNSGNNKNLTQVLAELKAEYLVKLPDKILKLKTLTSEKNWPALEEEYHNLKGTGKTYGFPEISAVCEKLESLAQRSETQLPNLFTEALHLLERMHQSYLSGLPFDLQNDSTYKSITKLKLGGSQAPDRKV